MKNPLKEYVRCIIEAKIAASASYMKKELVREKVQALIVASVADGTIKSAEDLSQFSKDIELSMSALKMIPFEVWQKMSGAQKKARKLAMKTSAEWWAGIKGNEKKFNAWLVKQHRGEVTAASRITQFAEKYATDVKHKALLGKIAEQEAQHATWVEGLLAQRGINTGTITDAEDRYWSATLPEIESFKTGAAVAAHAEAMRLERIKTICEDVTAPEDVRKVFKKIYMDEIFHEAAFKHLAGEDAMNSTAKSHAKGRELLGLVPLEHPLV